MGIEIQVLREGDGVNFPRKGQRVSVHYTGSLVDGSIFDSSVDRGRVFTFSLGLGEVIKGWDEAIAQISLGEIIKLTCPAEYGYGTRGLPGIIPPNSVLIFEIELKSFI